MNYTQLTSRERNLIDYLWNQEKKSITAIAEALKRNKSTISRELKRNKSNDIYDSNDAIFNSKIMSLAKHYTKVRNYEAFVNYFYSNFDKHYFGVAACIATAKKKGLKVPSIKTVYNWMNFNVIKLNHKHLLRPWKKPYFQKKYDSYLNKIPKDIIPIAYRPQKINQRKRVGDYEIDLVVSAKGDNSAILTLVDRKTRYGHSIKTNSKHMAHINDKLLELINRENLKIKSITKDNGMEFNAITKITKDLKIKVYTCNPYSSCEKGSNENFNGLLRRSFPKGTNFSNIDENELQLVISRINKMPRKLFGYNSAQSLYKALS